MGVARRNDAFMDMERGAEEMTKGEVAQIVHGMPEGMHIDDYLIELVNRAVAVEREACAKLVEADGLARGGDGLVLIKAAGRIRARGAK